LSWSPIALFDNRAYTPKGDPNHIDWVRVSPFIIMHLAIITLLFVGWSWTAVAVCFASYFFRMFGITAFYHRLLSHRAFQCPRWVAAAGAFLGNASAQRGPLWWAAHHRHHHKHSDQEGDAHSPIVRTLIQSHVTWFLNRENFATKEELVPDLAERGELQFLDRFDWFAPLVWALGCFGIGWAVNALGWENTSGWQTLVWGFVVATILTWHCTFLVNSLAHLWGSRPYKTTDHSRNNFFIAIVTLGEGWHNNHHYYQASARQGFRWWQHDISYYMLWMMKKVGLVTKLNPVPKKVIAKANQHDKADDPVFANKKRVARAEKVAADAEIDAIDAEAPRSASEESDDVVTPKATSNTNVTPASEIDTGKTTRSSTGSSETAGKEALQGAHDGDEEHLKSRAPTPRVGTRIGRWIGSQLGNCA
jgi:stearoyl-CoA desaturase (delta-9 desaturase)